jgi:hypothetical protein
MRRCGIAAGVIGFVVWCVAQALVSLVIWIIVAVPIGLLFAFDALAGERSINRTLTIVPPAPPRQPVAVRSRARLAA